MRTFPRPATLRVSKGNAAGCGLNTLESFAHYDLNSLSWKMYQLCFGGILAEFLGTWPRAGIMRSGNVYQLLPLALPTSGSASGLLPTPQSQDYQPICWARAERLVRGLKGRAHSGNAGGCMNLQDSMAAGWMLRQRLALRPPRGNMPRANPSYWEFLMGFPEGWTDLNASETPSFRKSSNGLEEE